MSPQPSTPEVIRQLSEPWQSGKFPAVRGWSEWWDRMD